MFALSLSMLGLACRAPAAQTKWQHMPLRTAAQKAAGELGGQMGQMVYTVTISPSAPQCMALGIDTAQVYISTDGGETWTSLAFERKRIHAVLLHPTDNRLLFVAGHHGLHRSDGTVYLGTDCGTWRLPRPE